MDNTKKTQFGPALAVVIILGVVAIAGLYFYKNMLADLKYDAGSTVVVPDGYFEANTQQEDEVELSSSTDLESIESDLDASLELDLTLLDDLDAQLLEFDDLEDIDFEIE